MPARLQPRFLLAAIALSWVLTTNLSAVGDEQPALLTMKSARVGVGGVCKSGFWAPIWLELAAGPKGARGTLEVVIRDGDNVPVVYADGSAADLSLSPDQDSSILRYAKIGPESAPIEVRLREAERVVWSQTLGGLPARLAATQELIVGVGPDLDLKAALATIRRSAEVAQHAVQTKSAAELPDRWWGYEGVDTVVLATSDAQTMQSITVEKSSALLQWIRLGGRLLVCVGSRGKELTAEGSPWAAIFPGKLVEVSAIREREGLETVAGVAIPWESDDFQVTRPLVTRLTDIDGHVLLDETGTGSDRPLLVRSAYGLGEVTFVGVDLDHPGFAKWPGRPKLLAMLLSGSHGRAQEEESETRRGVGHLGYDDLIGQLRAALEQFSGVTLVSFTTVSVLTAIYLLLIGPGDYLFLSRLNIPRQVTWLTFAIVALGFAVAAWAIGRSAHGDHARLNQVEIVDFDAKSGTLRGTAWAHLYSPATAQFTAEPRVDTQLLQTKQMGSVVAWQGLPGSALGGLAARQTVLAESEPYLVHTPAQQSGFVGLPIQSASSKSLSVRWWGERTGSPMSSLVRNEFFALDGRLSNPLPVELADCMVAFEDRLYRLGTLTPGQSIDLTGRAPLHLEARLTEKRVEAAKEVSTVWRRDSTDVPRIVQMLMFHEAARGRAYTGLTHRYQPYIDLSGHLQLGRAVLAGRSSQPFTRLIHDDAELATSGAQNAETWCRVVFPVRLSPSSTSQP